MNKPTSGAPTSRELRRQQTRERLLSTSIDLVRTEGVAAVSVSRVTREIGVHHTLFYSHFKTVDECLVAAAQQVQGALGPADAEFRARFFRENLNDPAALVEFYDRMLSRWLQHRPFVELLLAHRLDRSAFGEALRPLLDALRADLRTELWRVAARLGVDDEHRPEFTALADLCLSAWLWALEAMIEGTHDDRRALAQLLADVMFGGMTRTLQRRQRRTRKEMLDSRFPPEVRGRLAGQRRGWIQTLATRSEADIVADFGGCERTVDAVLRMVVEYFIPEAARGVNALLGYRIATADGVLDRWLRIHGERCEPLRDAGHEQAKFTLHMSLATFLQITCGARSFGEAFTAGELRLSGDGTYAPEVLSWFYMPGGAPEGDGPEGDGPEAGASEADGPGAGAPEGDGPEAG